MKFLPLWAITFAIVACSEDDIPTIIYPACPEVESEPLSKKAERFDEIGIRLHMPSGQDLMHSVFVEPDLETFDRASLSDNSGYWTSTYTAGQAFRYAATKSSEALANLKRALKGQHDLMRITGVPGLFARSYVNLDVPGFPTEQELVAHYPDCDLTVEHCKRWQRGTAAFDNFMFKNDVSRDEYAGHLFALGVIAEVVEDAQVLETARAMASQIGHHLIDNDLTIVDIDGEVTTFGYVKPGIFSGFPGFNAVQVLSWFSVAASLTGDARLVSFYENCLLQKDLSKCEKPDLATDKPYTQHLEEMGLNLDCQTNWNNHMMAQMAMFSLIRLEKDERTRSTYQRILQHEMWDPDDPRPMREQQNSLHTFFREVNRHTRDTIAEKELNDAVCVLRKFPEVKYQRAVDNTSYPEACLDRKGRPLTDVVIPFEERELDNFMWKKNPYKIEQCDENRQYIEAPDDFLLAYWLGRYFGILKAEI